VRIPQPPRRRSEEFPTLLRTRAKLFASALVLCVAASVVALGQVAGPQTHTPAGVISAIKVEGNQRIEAGTIRSYMLVQPGSPFDSAEMDRSLKTLYATGLFSDVKLRRDGDTLVVSVVENPIVNRIAFEGNHKVTDQTLSPEMQLRARAVYTPALAEADRQRILNAYAKRGRFGTTVVPKIIKLGQNRVDVVYEIHEGDSTYVSRIAFVGNKAFSESTLMDVVGSREEAWWRFLSTSDQYDPERVNVDKELLRNYYVSKGYADFEVVSANAELAPDRSAFFVTFTLHEGERYRVSSVEVNVTLPKLDGKVLRRSIEIEPGDWYNGEAVERADKALTQAVQDRGYAFVDVKPRIKRDVAKHTLDLAFDVGEGPRVYIERINIAGNQRTMDKVVRREMRVAEGDPFNATLLRDSRQRIVDLDFFNGVNVNATPGATPDKSVVNVNVQEKATGELSLGGGYSTDIGPLVSAGLRERNLVGTGIDGSINALLAQKQSQIKLSVTDPYFLDRNLVAGFDIFRIQSNLQDIANYSQSSIGITPRIGYEFTPHVRQLWTYSLIDRNIYNIQPAASLYVIDAKGTTLLSQIGQTLTVDYRDSKLTPHTGWVTRLGTDFAGIGGDSHFIRTKLDGAYYIPLDRFTGNSDWDLVFQGSVGKMFTLGGKQLIIDRFFLGGDNLRGFETAGAGPHSVPAGDSLGGNFIWTQTTELRFPLPVSHDLGLTGRAFVDVGSLSGVNSLVVNGVPIALTDKSAPRVGTGVGLSWKTPFGLLNIDVAVPVLKQKYDKSQLIRFGFGTRF
jgi:outer membrane protein insertion porin family